MTDNSSSQADVLRDHLKRALLLKELPRAGWVRAGIEAPESVAAHSWGVAYLVLALSPLRDDIDRGKALAIAVIHDLAEASTGDITPHDGIARAEKARLESSALEALVAPLQHGEELQGLWREFEEGTSREGRFVRACDKLDMALQAQRYAETQSHDTAEFIESALAEIEDEVLKPLAAHQADDVTK